MTEERFDEILNEMREEVAPAEQVTAARDRVWERLSGMTSLACSEIRPELGDYQSGRLSDSRRLLVDDHLSRCADCRRVLSERTTGHQVVAMPRPRQSRFAGWTRWAVAAGVALTILYMGRDRLDTAMAPSGPRATVVSVNGSLYRLPQNELQSGATLSDSDVVRTGAGCRAILQLADGSRVELNERTELAVQAAWSGQTIRLDRGDVIVQAAKQRRGHLRVATRDSVASVKGTVFAVSSSAAGSLVSVMEGSVAVSQPGAEKLLTAGRQTATNPALNQVKVRQAISWSPDAEKYLSLMAEFVSLEKQIAEAAPVGVRTEAKLLKYLPANAQVYFAIPNLDGTMREALRIIEQRTRENVALNEWWSSEDGQKIRQTLDRLQAVTPLLGDEVVIVLTKSGHQTPLLIAQVQPGRASDLKLAIDKLAEGHTDRIPYRVSDNVLVVSDSDAGIATMTAQMGSGATSPFAAEIAAHYARGVSWLAAVDVAAAGNPAAASGHGSLGGLSNAKYLFFEQRSGSGRDENEATLTFQGARTGIASWLAAPGSAGSTAYVSSDAVAVFSVSTKNPQQALSELLAGAGTMASGLREFESKTGVNLDKDIAGALGTDFTVVIERPSLPIPGWVGIFEVIRPTNLDEAVRRLVTAYNAELGPDQAARKATLTQETVNGRVWNVLNSSVAPAALHWTYDRGYLIVAMDRALALRALAVRDAGTSLVQSAAFQARFPASGSVHHSGFLWMNTKGLLADLAGLVQNPTLKSMLTSRDPLLVVLDGETERIRVASRTRLTSLILDAMMLANPGGAVQKSLL